MLTCRRSRLTRNTENSLEKCCHVFWNSLASLNIPQMFLPLRRKIFKHCVMKNCRTFLLLNNGNVRKTSAVSQLCRFTEKWSVGIDRFTALNDYRSIDNDPIYSACGGVHGLSHSMASQCHVLICNGFDSLKDQLKPSILTFETVRILSLRHCWDVISPHPGKTLDICDLY